ncbi:MAG: hypothetical protein ACRDRJ_33875, partial [Streptosporangiaceae bacterium]
RRHLTRHPSPAVPGQHNAGHARHPRSRRPDNPPTEPAGEPQKSLDISQWADRYVAQWNEPDPAARAKLIRELRADDGLQVLVDPP